MIELGLKGNLSNGHPQAKPSQEAQGQEQTILFKCYPYSHRHSQILFSWPILLKVKLGKNFKSHPSFPPCFHSNDHFLTLGITVNLFFSSSLEE